MEFFTKEERREMINRLVNEYARIVELREEKKQIEERYSVISQELRDFYKLEERIKKVYDLFGEDGEYFLIDSVESLSSGEKT